jgi:hypothetical protein
MITRLWMYLHAEAEDIGDRLVIIVVCGVALLYAVGGIS